MLLGLSNIGDAGIPLWHLPTCANVAVLAGDSLRGFEIIFRPWRLSGGARIASFQAFILISAAPIGLIGQAFVQAAIHRR